MFGLSLIQTEDVQDCFTEVFTAVMPVTAQPIADYLVDSYISEDSLFLLHPSASEEATPERTTCACEAFHYKFAQNFNSFRPYILLLLKC